jgi:hypothetical protein
LNGEAVEAAAEGENSSGLGKVGKTERGFEIVEFKDLYGAECSLQMSSLADKSAVWLGCDDADPKVMVPGSGWKPVEMPNGYIANTRMHLDTKMVQAIIKHLQSWLETETFAAHTVPENLLDWFAQASPLQVYQNLQDRLREWREHAEGGEDEILEEMDEIWWMRLSDEDREVINKKATTAPHRAFPGAEPHGDEHG